MPPLAKSKVAPLLPLLFHAPKLTPSAVQFGETVSHVPLPPSVLPSPYQVSCTADADEANEVTRPMAARRMVNQNRWFVRLSLIIGTAMNPTEFLVVLSY